MESPTKAKTLARFLGSDYRIMASMGHVRDLPESKLGIDVEHDFTPEYVISDKKKDVVTDLKKAYSEADKLILATDPDREGEAISWHIAAILGDKGHSKSQIQRITFHEITQGAIKDALAHPGNLDIRLVDAQQARRILDRLVGYKLSPLLWKKVRRGLSAGRVQSVAVRLIVEREREITAFKAEEYWDIIATFKVLNSENQGPSAFEAKLIKINDKNIGIKNQPEAEEITGLLEKAEFKITDVSKKEVRRNPYPPFTTSTLQQAASNLIGWSAKRTMQVAQNLYEQGLITYHRTDSTNLAIEAVTAVRKYIGETYGEKYVPDQPRLYKTKSKVAQEAHEAIRPTAAEGLAAKEHGLDRDQIRLYELIWKRFVACQMTEAVYEQTAVDVSTDVSGATRDEIIKYLFRANGSRQMFDGWQKLYEKIAPANLGPAVKEGESEENLEANNNLPEMIVGMPVELIKLIPLQHFTLPPPRYNEASLIKILEEYGIGRPSTYAPIISTIQDRQYVEKQDKKFIPTNLGFAVNDFLMANFPTIFDYKFTAGMENSLDEIANGEKAWVPVIREFYSPFEETLKTVTETAERVKVETEESDELCPDHNVPLLVRIGKFGKFLACSKFPDCKFTKPYMQKINVKCPKCLVGEVILKRTKTKKSFYGCSRYPECDWASWTKPKTASVNETN